MTDTTAINDRIGELCHQFRLPTMGAQSVARFTAAGHGDALETLLEVLVLSIPMPAFRAVQGEVTAEPASDVYAPGEACRPDEGRIDIGAGCPVLSMVRESYGCIIGDAPTGGAPVW